VTIALLITTIWSMVSLIYNIIQSTSPIYLLNMLVIIVAQIWLLNWLCGMLKHSRQLSSKPKFVVVFWSLFAVVVFCAFVGISPFSDIKNTAAIAIAEWWGQRTATTETPVEIPEETSAENPPPPPTNPDPTTTVYGTDRDKYPNRIWINDYTALLPDA
jgi:hypothetical protein